MTHFFQLILRTSDVEAARSFYTGLLGEGALSIFQLHEQAVARGARPHWLGCIEVAEVERSASDFIARGAVALGPSWVNPEGLGASILRDPGGAIVAVAKPPAARANEKPYAERYGPDVVWYALNTNDVERAKANYAELFGWHFHAAVDLGVHGSFYPFSYEAGAKPVGSLGEIADRPSVHPHWLFHFRVPALELAVEAVRAAGGSATAPVTLPSGERVTVCDDPQGAAFALLERSPA